MEFQASKININIYHMYILIKIIQKILPISCVDLTSFPNNLFALLVDECF